MATSRTGAALGTLRRGRRSLLLALLTGLLGVATAAPAHAIRVATWNLLQYPTTALAARQPYFRTSMAALDPDLLVCQEINTAAGKDSFLLNVLGVIEPGQWSGTFIDVGTGEGMAAFWKPARVSVATPSAISTGGPRNVMSCIVRIPGYPTAVLFRVLSAHFKAGNPATSPADSTTRRLECTSLRSTLNTLPANTPFLLLGDSNFYGDWEGGYQRLTESQSDNDGRLQDQLTMPGTWNSSAYRFYHTQSPCFAGCIDPNFAGGGMDDRFDLALPSLGMLDGAGFDLVPGSTVAFGNDGAHYNTDINGDQFNFAVGYQVATALRNSSDHIPVYVDVQLPARVAANSALDVGRAILGGAPTAMLGVADAAIPPADELNYSLTAPAGFTAPGGGFTALAGASANLHAIGMDTGTTGTKSGTLTVASNAADTANKSVLLSGTVIRHASPSLDSLASVTATSLDFGSHAILHFDDADVRVHDRGFDALQAQLAVSGAVITGGNGRFSIVGGFSPAQIGGTGVSYALHFDSFGATLDSTYTGTLTLSSADEPLPGAGPVPDLTVSLSARPISGVLGAPGARHLLRFEPARPNPLSRGTTFAYELPRAQGVALEIYDLGGRRLASLTSGEQSAGRHEVRWGAVDANGARVSGGLYFARFSTAGLSRIERVIVLP
jgi:hypothetical protein